MKTEKERVDREASKQERWISWRENLSHSSPLLLVIDRNIVQYRFTYNNIGKLYWSMPTIFNQAPLILWLDKRNYYTHALHGVVVGAKLACRRLADEDDASQIHPRVTKKFLEMMVDRKISPAQHLILKNLELIKSESFTFPLLPFLKNLLFAQRYLYNFLATYCSRSTKCAIPSLYLVCT